MAKICYALNSLPDAQGQRIFEHYLLGHPVKAMADAGGVMEQAITAAIRRGFPLFIYHNPAEIEALTQISSPILLNFVIKSEERNLELLPVI